MSLFLVTIHQSTEMPLLYIHDHLTNAIGSQKVSCLRLLGLSAAFDNLTITFWSLASHPGSSESMALFSAGSHHICHLAASVSNVTIICLPGTHPPAVSPRFCFRSFTLHCIHHSSEYSHFFLFPKSTPLCRWQSAVLILPPSWLRLQYWSPSERSNSNSDSIVLWHFFRWFHRLTTLIIHHTPYSFILGIKTSFTANPSNLSLLFLLQDWLHWFPGLFTDTFEHRPIRFLHFNFFLFFHFLVFGSVR